MKSKQNISTVSPGMARQNEIPSELRLICFRSDIGQSPLVINVKKLWFIHELTAHNTSKTAKITKR